MEVYVRRFLFRICPMLYTVGLNVTGLRRVLPVSLAADLSTSQAGCKINQQKIIWCVMLQYFAYS